MENRVWFRIGEIEFEAEGSAEVIERERKEFVNTLLPVAIEAIVRTRGAEQGIQYVEAQKDPALLSEGTTIVPATSETKVSIVSSDLYRTSLASFVKGYGVLTDQDFALIAAYYDEKKNGTSFFTSESIKGYYAEARKAEYSNVSVLLNQLAKKGYIMDNPGGNGKSPKQYILTTDGITYIETYKSKEKSEEKKKVVSKARRTHSMQSSTYNCLDLDDLNIKTYPEVKALDKFKKQMLLVMYIVTNEGKGEFFSVADVQYLMTNIWGLTATIDQINGVFKDNRGWFLLEQNPNNKKVIRRKLLEAGKDFAREIIQAFSDGKARETKQ